MTTIQPTITPTALEAGALLTSVHFKVPVKAAYAMFPTPASRFALVGVFIAKFNDNVRVAVTGAGPCAFRVKSMEEALAKNFAVTALDGLSVPATGLNSDIHAASDYRQHLISVMAARAVLACG